MTYYAPETQPAHLRAIYTRAYWQTKLELAEMDINVAPGRRLEESIAKRDHAMAQLEGI